MRRFRLSSHYRHAEGKTGEYRATPRGTHADAGSQGGRKGTQEGRGVMEGDSGSCSDIATLRTTE